LEITIDNLNDNQIEVVNYPNSDYKKLNISNIDINIVNIKLDDYDATELATYLVEKFKLEPEDVGFDIDEIIEERNEVKIF
jgi:hypothetical protein